MMELRALRQFLAVVEQGSVVAAANHLGMAQPPLSVAIQKLEREIGAPLFVRRPRGVDLTEAGRALVQPAREILGRASQLRQFAVDVKDGRRGLLRIGFVGSASYRFLPRAIRQFRTTHPLIELQLHEMSSKQIIASVEVGALDVGLVRLPMLYPSKVAIGIVSTEQMMLMVPKEHRLRGDRAVALEALSSEPFVMYELDAVPSMRSLAVGACERAGFSPRIVQDATQIHGLVALVESGLGVALLPACVNRFAPERGRFLQVSAAGAPITTSIGIAVAASGESPAASAFREVALALPAEPSSSC